MTTVANIAVALVAVLHLYFLVLEMFLWETAFGRRTFGLTAELAAASRSLAANQGLYNGFLAAGLAWSFIADAAFATQLRFFFLAFVLVAGLYGAATAAKKILYVQAIPAALALVVTWLARS